MRSLGLAVAFAVVATTSLAGADEPVAMPPPSLAPAPATPPVATPNITVLPVTPPLPPPAPPPAAMPPAPAITPADDDPLFRLHYASARNSLVTGDFAGAAAEFAIASRVAMYPCNRVLAEEQRVLAAEWASRKLIFVERGKGGDGASARAVDKRTSDEIISLYTNAAVYGIGTGIWVDVVTQSSNTTEIVLPILLLGGAAVVGVAGLDAGRGLRYGVAQSIVSGMYIGLEEGTAWTLWAAASPGSTLSGTAAATIVWGATTGGIVAGGLIATAIPVTPGRAAYVGSTSLWGGVVLGLAGGAVLGGESVSAPFFTSGVGVTAGAVTGLLTAGMVSPSISHMRFIDLGGIGGMIVGGGIYLAAANNNVNAQALAGTAAVGTVAGLATAWFATRDMARDEGVTKEEPSTTGITWNPTVMPAKGGGMLGLVGSL